MEEKKLNIG